MLAIALSVLAFAFVGHAQNTTASLLLPFADSQSLVGSIAGSVRTSCGFSLSIELSLTALQDATATTYVVECPPRAATPIVDKEKRQASGPSESGAAEGTEEASRNYDDRSDSECGFPKPVTIIQGESTLQFENGFGELYVPFAPALDHTKLMVA